MLARQIPHLVAFNVKQFLFYLSACLLRFKGKSYLKPYIKLFVMSNSRRTFIKKSTLALAGSSLLSPVSIANTNMKDNELVGIQLYSVRDDMGKDPLGT